MNENRIAVVTGANRGLGFGIARQLALLGIHVILTARDKQAGAKALRKLDVNTNEDAKVLADYIRANHGHLDILVNNAAILPESTRDQGARSADPLKVSSATVMEILNTNTLGPIRMIQALAPLMRQGGRIVNVSTGMAVLGRMCGDHLGYRVSKTALNAVTCAFAAELSARGILVNSVDPGWVRTDMGGEGATRSVEQGAETVVWLASAPEATESGCFWHDKKKIAW